VSLIKSRECPNCQALNITLQTVSFRSTPNGEGEDIFVLNPERSGRGREIVGNGGERRGTGTANRNQSSFLFQNRGLKSYRETQRACPISDWLRGNPPCCPPRRIGNRRA